MKGSRFSSEEKFKIVLESLRGDRSISEICRDYGIAQSVFYKWRDKFLQGAQQALKPSRGTQQRQNSEIRQLKQIIGELTIENQILKKTQELLGRE